VDWIILAPDINENQNFIHRRRTSWAASTPNSFSRITQIHGAITCCFVPFFRSRDIYLIHILTLSPVRRRSPRADMLPCWWQMSRAHCWNDDWSREIQGARRKCLLKCHFVYDNSLTAKGSQMAICRSNSLTLATSFCCETCHSRGIRFESGPSYWLYFTEGFRSFFILSSK
jgi:hypothetical protein